MLATKKITLGSFSENLEIDQSIIKNEDRDIVSSYEDHILKKTIEADKIINEAHEAAKSIAKDTREEAEKEFWKYTQRFFEDLHAIRASIIEGVERQCHEVVLASLSNLLDSVPSEDKIRPMIKSLLSNKINDEAATVYVHPEQLALAEPITAALSVAVKEDDKLEVDSVVLKTEKNEYKSSFKGKLKLLIRAVESM